MTSLVDIGIYNHNGQHNHGPSRNWKTKTSRRRVQPTWHFHVFMLRPVGLSRFLAGGRRGRGCSHHVVTPINGRPKGRAHEPDLVVPEHKRQILAAISWQWVLPLEPTRHTVIDWNSHVFSHNKYRYNEYNMGELWFSGRLCRNFVPPEKYKSCFIFTV